MNPESKIIEPKIVNEPVQPKKVLFIDRDGTLIKEAPPTYQLDSFSKLEFYPDMFFYMRKIATKLDYELVIITNQDIIT